MQVWIAIKVDISTGNPYPHLPDDMEVFSTEEGVRFFEEQSKQANEYAKVDVYGPLTVDR